PERVLRHGHCRHIRVSPWELTSGCILVRSQRKRNVTSFIRTRFFWGTKAQPLGLSAAGDARVWGMVEVPGWFGASKVGKTRAPRGTPRAPRRSAAPQLVG